MTINIGNTNGRRKPSTASRASCEAARVAGGVRAGARPNVINKVVFNSSTQPDCGPISPVSPWFDKGLTCAGREPRQGARARGEGGVKTPIPVKPLLEARSQNERLGQVIQAMAREAGFG